MLISHVCRLETVLATHGAIWHTLNALQSVESIKAAFVSNDIIIFIYCLVNKLDSTVDRAIDGGPNLNICT